MKKLIVVLCLTLFFSVTQRLSAEVSLDFFYDSLADDGNWFEADDYGYCWQPNGISDDWSPYTDGYWTYTDAGWTWVSYESFGWATYHYGRWTKFSGRGWVWIPGYEWGPAWVSWRSDDDYIGWAPLPPRAIVTSSISIGSWVDSYYDIGPSYYNFTPCRRFGSPSIRQVIVDRSQNITIINRTTNITNISYRKNVVYNGGPDYDRVNRRSDRKIEQLRLERRAAVAGRERRFSRRENGRLNVVAPVVVPVNEKQRPRNVRANLGKVREEKGWGSVRDPKLAERTREAIRRQNQAKVPAAVREERQKSAHQVLRQEARMKSVAASQVRNPSNRVDQPRGKNATPQNNSTASNSTKAPALSDRSPNRPSQPDRETRNRVNSTKTTENPSNEAVNQQIQRQRQIEARRQAGKANPSVEPTAGEAQAAAKRRQSATDNQRMQQQKQQSAAAAQARQKSQGQQQAARQAAIARQQETARAQQQARQNQAQRAEAIQEQRARQNRQSQQLQNQQREQAAQLQQRQMQLQQSRGQNAQRPALKTQAPSQNQGNQAAQSRQSRQGRGKGQNPNAEEEN